MTAPPRIHPAWIVLGAVSPFRAGRISERTGTRAIPFVSAALPGIVASGPTPALRKGPIERAPACTPAPAVS